MSNKFITPTRIETLKGRAKRCCCKYCGSKLEIRRIIFSNDEEARIELFCTKCDKIEYGVEPEIYRNAAYFVDRLKFNHFPDMDKNEQTRRLNIAKVCEIMTWGDIKLGILQHEGFLVPVKSCPRSEYNGLVLDKETLMRKDGEAND